MGRISGTNGPACSPPEGTYNMIIPVDRNDLRNLAPISRAFHRAFQLKFHWGRTRKKRSGGYRAGKNGDCGLAPSSPQEFNGYNSGKFTAFSMDDLCEYMERKMQNTPVLNESDLPGAFNFTLNDDVLFDARTIPKHVRELGLDVQNAKRRIRVLVVEHE